MPARLLDGRESSDRLIEPVVVLVVVAHGYFSEKDSPRPFLHMEIMVEIRLDRDALPPASV